MALDGVAVCALVKEFDEKLVGLRIDKIYQPEHDEIHITLHGFGNNYRLLLTANANVARACFTEDSKPNPTQPPMFCMLLRKHLGAGKISAVHQPGFERVIEFCIETYNELGDIVVKTLVVELMGRHSNIILVDENGRVADSIKRVDFSVSTVRQILPGIVYEAPPAQDKMNPIKVGTSEILEVLKAAPDGEKLDRVLLSSFVGVSPLIAREISYRALGTSDIYMSELDFSKQLDVATKMYNLFSDISQGKFSPCVLINKETEKPIEFSPVDIMQYGDLSQKEYTDSFANLADRFYKERDKKERMAHRAAHLVKLVATNIERCAKKLHLQQKELNDTQKKEKWQQYGELITANIYRIEQGAESVVVQNYFEEEMPEVSIPLDVRLSPSANAQKYYKKYNKAKTAEQELTRQIELAESELGYLETVEEELEKAVSEADLSEIADELAEQGYIRRVQKDKKNKQKISSPMEFVTSDGFCVVVGRNNKQNDALTLKTARGADLWFHTKNIPGSHTLLVHEHDREFTDKAILEAAQLAAFYSKAKESANVPVDYTLIKNVKKPAGSKPGFVIYTTNQTAYVTPPKDVDSFIKK
ncbi:MAG: NFACT family protein [Clostridia bacterium]|nr:NFACT family protein [Clostridia bacterium]